MPLQIMHIFRCAKILSQGQLVRKAGNPFSYFERASLTLQNICVESCQIRLLTG